MTSNCERCKLVDELVCEKMLKIKELEFQLAEKQKENEELRKQQWWMEDGKNKKGEQR